jgi:hypothetical protein
MVMLIAWIPSDRANTARKYQLEYRFSIIRPIVQGTISRGKIGTLPYVGRLTAPSDAAILPPTDTKDDEWDE